MKLENLEPHTLPSHRVTFTQHSTGGGNNLWQQQLNLEAVNLRAHTLHQLKCQPNYVISFCIW